MQSVIYNNEAITPSKVICVGRNYYAHIAELNNEIPSEMVLFLKPNSSIANTLLSYQGEQLHYEGELCFMYAEGRFSAIGFGLDLTKRQLQSTLKTKGLPWERAKAFNGSAVFSEFIPISDTNAEFSFELKKNAEVVQQGHTQLMIYKPQAILSEIQSFMSLNDGDIVMTGTPKGVGTISKGDKFESSIQYKQQTILEKAWIAA